MVEVKRYKQCVIVYDEDKGRGITFPANETIHLNQYCEELNKICCSKEFQAGLLVIPLTFDPEIKGSYKPIKEFLEGKKGNAYLDDDEHAKELYEFYFEHSMPQISPGGVDYIYGGKEYHSRVDITFG